MLHPRGGSGDDSIEMPWILDSPREDIAFESTFSREFVHQNVMHSWKRLTFDGKEEQIRGYEVATSSRVLKESVLSSSEPPRGCNSSFDL